MLRNVSKQHSLRAGCSVHSAYCYSA